MKHIKKYEPEIGDYVALQNYVFWEPWTSYINNQIGQMIDKSGLRYLIKTYISDDVYDEIFRYTEQKKFTDEDENGNYIIMKAKIENIAAFGKTVDEVKIRKNANKYNL